MIANREWALTSVAATQLRRLDEPALHKFVRRDADKVGGHPDYEVLMRLMSPELQTSLL